MMALPIGSPPSSTATVPDHCEVQPTPTTASGLVPLSASARRDAATMASHHSPGDCSAPPSSVSCTDTGSNACETTLPPSVSSAALGPPVPRSTASTNVLDHDRRPRRRGLEAERPQRPGGRGLTWRESVRVHGQTVITCARPDRSEVRAVHASEGVSRPGWPRPPARSRPCCRPPRCRRGASG